MRWWRTFRSRLVLAEYDGRDLLRVQLAAAVCVAIGLTSSWVAAALLLALLVELELALLRHAIATNAALHELERARRTRADYQPLDFDGLANRAYSERARQELGL